MKLPGVQIGGVQPLRADAPSKEGQALKGLGQAVSQYAEVHSQIKMNKWKQESEQASVDLAKNISQFEKEHFSKSFYTPDELPADSSVPRTRQVVNENGVKVDVPREQIPAYEVWPELYQARMQEELAVGATSITNDAISSRWKNNMESKAAASYSDFSSKVVAEQQKQQVVQSKQNMIDLVDLGEYGAARSVATNMNATDLEKEQATQTINVTEETDGYQEQMIEATNTGDVTELKKTLETMQTDYKGYLGITDQHQVEHKIIAHIGGVEKGNGSYDKLYAKGLNRELLQMSNGLKDGKDMSVLDITNLQDKADSWAITSRDHESIIYNNHINFNEAQRTNLMLRSLILGQSRTQAYAELSKVNMQELDPITRSIVTDVKTGYDKFNSAMDADAVQAALDYGISGVTPIDFTNSQTMGQSILDRRATFSVLQEGYNTDTHMLSDNERSEYNRILNDGGIGGGDKGRLEMMKMISGILGPDAQPFWDGIVDDKYSGAYAVAGSLSNNNPGLAMISRDIITGKDILDNNPEAVSAIRQDSQPAVSKALYAVSTGAGDSGQIRARSDAVWALYAVRMNGDYGKLNNKVLKQSINDVIGGQVDFNGRELQVPVPGMNPSNFQSWLENMTPASISAAGLGGINKELLAEGIREGDYSLIPAGYPRNEYYIQSVAREGTARSMFLDAGGNAVTITFEQDTYAKQTRDGRAAYDNPIKRQPQIMPRIGGVVR